VQVSLLLAQLQNQQRLKVYHVPRLIGQQGVFCEISSLRQCGNGWAVEGGGGREVFHVDQTAENAQTDEEGLLLEFRLVVFVVVFRQQHEDELVVAVCHELLHPRLPLLPAAGTQLVLNRYQLVIYLKLRVLLEVEPALGLRMQFGPGGQEKQKMLCFAGEFSEGVVGECEEMLIDVVVVLSDFEAHHQVVLAADI
jgi:hypothetical protein